MEEIRKKRWVVLLDWNNISLKKKLITIFLIMSIIPVIIVGYLSYTNAKEAIETQAFDALENVATLKEGEIEVYFEGLENDLAAIAHTGDVNRGITALVQYHKEMGIGPDEPYDLSGTNSELTKTYQEIYDEIDKRLDTYVEEKGYYDILIICKDHGHVMYSHKREADIGTNLRTGPYKDSILAQAWNAARTGEHAITDIEHYAPIKDEPALFAAAPIEDENGGIIGVVALRANLEELNKIMTRESGAGKTEDHYLVGEDMLLRSNSRLTNEETMLEKQTETHELAISFKTKDTYHGVYESHMTKEEAEEQGRTYSTKLEGVNVLGVTHYLEELNWILVAEIDEWEAYAAVDTLRIITALIVIITAILVSIAGLLIAQTITKPIKKGVTFAKTLATGDFTKELELERKDEIGQLADALNTMRKELTKIIQTIQQSVDVSATNAEEFSAGAEETNSSMQQVSATINDISTDAQELSRLAMTGKEKSDATNTSATKGKENAEKLQTQMKQIKESTQQTTTKIQELGTQSKEIGEIVSTINKISEQTNLLALNAAIEAARAGDAGKGFAVVADEVRKLAEDSKKATGKITERIAKIQQEIDESVNAMNTNTELVDKGEMAVNQAVEAFNEIPQLVKELDNVITNVTTTAEKNAAASEEVNANLQQVTAASQQVAEVSQKMASESGELNDLVKKFKF